jgi:hypothetical protein
MTTPPPAIAMAAPIALGGPPAYAVWAGGSDVALVTYIGIALIIGGTTALLWPWLVRLVRTAGAGRRGGGSPRRGGPRDRDLAAVMSLDETYDSAACARFVEGLGDQVLVRVRIFFRCLADEGEVDSALLAERLGATPSEVAGLVITPLARRSEAVGAPAPFVAGQVPGTRRRLWRDQGRIAERLGDAIDVELARRAAADVEPPSEGRSGGGATAA